jgi:hypothetical protein
LIKTKNFFLGFLYTSTQDCDLLNRELSALIIEPHFVVNIIIIFISSLPSAILYWDITYDCLTQVSTHRPVRVHPIRRHLITVTPPILYAIASFIGDALHSFYILRIDNVHSTSLINLSACWRRRTPSVTISVILIVKGFILFTK